jgi:hypothetical protein
MKIKEKGISKFFILMLLSVLAISLMNCNKQKGTEKN